MNFCFQVVSPKFLVPNLNSFLKKGEGRRKPVFGKNQTGSRNK
ncbi:hypothetical protein [Microcoleus sp. S11D4]